MSLWPVSVQAYDWARRAPPGSRSIAARCSGTTESDVEEEQCNQLGHRVPKRSELSALPERQGKLRWARFFLGSSLDEARSARRATLVAGRGRAAGGLRVKRMWRLRKHPHLNAFDIDEHNLYLMAAYLPLLVGSVANNNAISDDSSVTTQPRGQVDYLSHQWLEEDVWKSWRNMTKQKNEIANGARLENASWRTWWKQRNGLKTISPETLNWLKDSDVTWLYGPLHTAVEWTPPPKPKPDPTSVDDRAAASAHDRLNLSSPYIRHKPILKHRSISELLTSELPASPLFSPAESEDEGEGKLGAGHNGHLDTVPEAEEEDDSSKRPSLMYTKSDSHIAKWPDRTFRKDSPPRVPPPNHPPEHEPRPTHHLYSHNSDPSKQKKHISFNTFVEQCIAIDKPSEPGTTPIDSAAPTEVVLGSDAWRHKAGLNKAHWVGYDEYDDEDDEDDDGEGSPWDNTNESAIGSDESDEDDEGFIQMRGSSYHQAPNKPRSKSKTSDSSASTSSSSSTGSRPRRKSSSGNRLAPSFHRANGRKPTLEEPKPPVHVTIAPIAPTMLKVGKEPEDSVNGWTEGLGDDGDDDSGYKYYGKWSPNNHSDVNAPVELVYAPPNGRQADQFDAVESPTPRVGFGPHSAVAQDEGAEEERVDDVDVREDNGPEDAGAHNVGVRQVVPVVTRTSPTTVSRDLEDEDLREEDAYEYFSSPDMGSSEDFASLAIVEGRCLNTTIIIRIVSTSANCITSPGSAYANGRSNGRERERGRDRSGKRLNSSLSPGSPDPVDGTRVSLDAVAASAVAEKNSSNSTINGNASDTTINTPVAQTGHNEVQAKTNGVPSGITKSRPVVAPSTPAPTSPTRTHAKSFSVSLPVVSTSTTPPSKSPEDSPIRRSPSSPSSPGHVKSSSMNALQHNLDHEGGIVGRAIDAVSHAGALLGLWHNHHHNHHATQGSQAH
ncbi:hypothetical protein FB107DRAFT_288711 [Schizophyllum commune]